MTYAPDDLKKVQAYCHQLTGQDWASLGIVGDTSHNSSGGYHVGHDVLHALGTAPEDPGGDYSYTESTRDRAGLTDAASAFDLGGDFPRFREITLALVAACQRNDPRTRDIREVIYTPDGRTVKRFDRLGRRSTGDSSHLSHTHISFFRDAEGRRAGRDNFLGLLVELFEGKEVADVALRDDFDGVWMINRIQAMANLDQPQFGPEQGHELAFVAALREIRANAAAARAAAEKVQLGGVDLDALAAKVAALLPKPPTADEVAQKIAERLGNG